MITSACKFYRASSSFWGSRSGLHMDLISYQSIFSWLEPRVWVLQCVCVLCTLSHKHMHACMHAWLLSPALCFTTGAPEVAGLAAAHMTQYLAGEEAAHTNDAEDVKDGRAHDGPHPHVTFRNKHPWEENNTHTHTGLYQSRVARWLFATWHLQLQHSTRTAVKTHVNNI